MSLSNLSILKIGGSVITDKNNISSIRKNEIDRIVQEIKSFIIDSNDKIILVHGAGSFGHPQTKNCIDKGFTIDSVQMVHNSIKELNTIFIEYLNNANLDARSIHPLNCCILDNNKISYFPIDDINLMLNQGIVPVIHGDLVVDIKLGVSILSGDKIVAYLSSLKPSAKIGAGCDVDGVFDRYGRIIKKITPEIFADIKNDIINNSQYINSGKVDMTGGMLGKVNEFLELAKIGISSRIFNASKKGMVSRFLYGDNVGTLISR